MSPDADERVRTLTFPKEQKDGFFNVWYMKSFFMKPVADYKQLSDMLKSHMQVRQGLAIAVGTWDCLHRLHMRGISQKNLLLDDIYVSIGPTGRCKVALDSRPELAHQQKRKDDNMKQFSEILKTILDECKKD